VNSSCSLLSIVG